MQDWMIISLAAFTYVFVLVMFSRVTGMEKRQRELSKLAKRMKEKKDEVSEAEVMEAFHHMNKMMVMRMVITLMLFYPLYSALNARYGIISTPLGEWNWLWWFFANLVAANIVIGGVIRWLAPYSEG